MTPKIFAVGARVDEAPVPLPDDFEPVTDVSVENKGEWITITASGRPRRARRKMFRQLPFGSVPSFAPICLDSNDPDTVRAGLMKRLLRPVPSPDPHWLAELTQFVKEWLTANVPTTEPLPFEEWLEGTSYTDARKDELRRCYNDLKGGVPNRTQRRKIKSFVKTEGYGEYKNCRLINSRSDHFKVFSGPRFKAIENVLYNHPAFVKHVPVPERPALIAGLRQAGMKYYGTDYTAFESHFTPQIMRAVEFQLYRHCLPNDAHLPLLLSTIGGKNVMVHPTNISTCEARRMSGETNTSLGNGFTNLMLALFLAHKKGGRLNGFVEGDDGIFACDFDLKAEDYAKLGFTIKIAEFQDPCEASFCGMTFASSGQILRDPRRFIAGFGWTSSFIHSGDKIMAQLLRAKALSAVYETPHCPIVGVLAREALGRTEGVAPRFINDGYHRIPRDTAAVPAYDPSPDTRILFERAFGVSIADQLEMESLIRRGDLSRIPAFLRPHSDMAHFEARYVEST